jgi:hypothetical protein
MELRMTFTHTDADRIADDIRRLIRMAQMEWPEFDIGQVRLVNTNEGHVEEGEVI